MNLSKTTLEAIDTPKIRLSLALALDLTEQTIIRYITTNSDCLTKAAALKVIKQQTGISEKDLFEKSHA